MYYVSYYEEYPIYEPAEGGYYYAGEQILDCVACSTWKKAKRVYRRWKSEFKSYYDSEKDRVFDYETGGCDKYGDGSHIRYSSRYIGEGCGVRITRYKPTGKGRVPYC